MRKFTGKKELFKQLQYYQHLSAHYEKKFGRANHLYKHFKTQFAPGHFYSPYVDLKDVVKRKAKIFDRSERDIPGINIRKASQLSLLKKLSKHYPEFPYNRKSSAKTYRYKLGLHAYSYTDAAIFFCVLQEYRPRRVIEIGSGYSSALLMDFNDYFNQNRSNITFIEPYPDLLLSLLKSEDSGSYKLIEEPLHNVTSDTFSHLESGDVLFIDSTHVSKPGSDVNQLFFEVLPKLNQGVIIHIHDIFYPFEYPIEWVYETRAWNEDYILRAFLYKNPDFQIMLFNHYINLHHSKLLGKLMPLTKKNSGGSLWLKKVN